MGRSVKHQRKPSREKIKTPFESPKTGEYWIRDIAAKATYFPTTLAKFKRTYNRLRNENRELTTSHTI